MKAIIKINMNGSAFSPDPSMSDELSRILRQKTADNLNHIAVYPGDKWHLKDKNGNHCGVMSITEGVAKI